MAEAPRRPSFRGALIVILIAVPILGVLAAAGFWYGLDRPPQTDASGTTEFTVLRGEGISEVAERLEDEDLVSDGRYVLYRYKILSRLGWTPPLKAGRYVLDFGARPSEIIRILTTPGEGRRVYADVTIPPGLTARRIAQTVEAAGLARGEDVRRAIREMASEYPVLSTVEGLQGYLFPDTYRIEKPLDDSEVSSAETARIIVKQMADRFFDVLTEIDPTWTGLTRVQLHEKVTLASIVEREYRVDDEAPLIAAVFNNRLVEGMPLQSCATVVYTIQETEIGAPFLDEYLRYERRIFERYLEIPSAYNTYVQPDLPPGPICIPGRVALDAAFYPAASDALFFVVKDPAAGTHTFSRDYGDHLEARDQYLNQFVVKD